MTNLIAIITFQLATNWVSINRITPIVPKEHQFDAIMRYNQIQQFGYRVTNIVATFTYEGKEIQTLLKIFPSNVKCDERMIAEDPFAIFNYQNFFGQ